jgi:hypothetical protein
MDSKKYADKVIHIHDFSLECYPSAYRWGYIFIDNGVDVLNLYPSVVEDKNVTKNFIFSIIGRFYEHFISNLCVKEEYFWYVWDIVVYDLNRGMIEKSYSHLIPNRRFYDQMYEPDFLLPNSYEFIRSLEIGLNCSRASGGLGINYLEHDFTNHNTIVKELRIPLPETRKRINIDRNLYFNW